MGKRANPAVVGAFVIGAVVLAVIAVGLFGSGRMFRTTYKYIMYFTGDVNGLKEGAPVKLKGVQVGSVHKVLLNAGKTNVFQQAAKAGGFSQLHIPVIVEFDQDAFTQRGGLLSPEPETVKRLIELGLRGRLAMESFVTGVLYIELDLLPKAPLNHFADDTAGYVEIPTLLTPLEEVQMQASRFLSHLEGIDFKELVDSLARTASGLDRLINSPSLEQSLNSLPETIRKIDQVASDASTTLASFRQLSAEIDRQVEPTAQSVRALAAQTGAAIEETTRSLQTTASGLDPDSALMHQLSQSLEDLSTTALAIRRLAEELDRDPSVLIRGKYVSEEPK